MSLLSEFPAVKDVPSPEAEVLIEEARRRQHRRRRVVALAVILVVAGAAIGYGVFRGGPQNGRSGETRSDGPQGRAAGTTTEPVVTPKEPEALAVGRNGTVYVVDPGRDEILRRLSDGKFVIFAGNGKVGFSGDGGPARDARLHLLYDSGIAVSGNGIVYFTDAGNDRVRAVLPNHTIETVAGGGTVALGHRPLPAQEASLGRSYGGVAGLTIGRDGQLYLATNAGVYRLAPNGDLYWVVGETVPLPPNWGGVYSNPAIQNDFISADRLAFDGAGDLYVAGGGGWGLYEMRANGSLQFIEIFRGEGAGTFGSLASDPDGSVVESDNAGVFARAPDGKTTTITTSKKLSELLGNKNTFTGGYGVAVDSRGDIFVDMDASVWSSTAALIEVRPNGTTTTLWRRRELP